MVRDFNQQYRMDPFGATSESWDKRSHMVFYKCISNRCTILIHPQPDLHLLLIIGGYTNINACIFKWISNIYNIIWPIHYTVVSNAELKVPNHLLRISSGDLLALNCLHTLPANRAPENWWLNSYFPFVDALFPGARLVQGVQTNTQSPCWMMQPSPSISYQSPVDSSLWRGLQQLFQVISLWGKPSGIHGFSIH